MVVMIYWRGQRAQSLVQYPVECSVHTQHRNGGETEGKGDDRGGEGFMKTCVAAVALTNSEPQGHEWDMIH